MATLYLAIEDVENVLDPLFFKWEAARNAAVDEALENFNHDYRAPQDKAEEAEKKAADAFFKAYKKIVGH